MTLIDLNLLVIWVYSSLKMSRDSHRLLVVVGITSIPSESSSFSLLISLLLYSLLICLSLFSITLPRSSYLSQS
jgi:hypothetical protein